MDHARSKEGLLGSYLDLIPFLIFKEEFEDIKGVIRIRKSKKDRRHNGQKKRGKSTNNDSQNIHIKLKIEKHEPH